MERREHPRASVCVRAVVCLIDGEGMPIEPEECQVMDISISGAKLVSDKYCHLRQVLLLTMRPFEGAEVHTLPSSVVWSERLETGSFMYGVRFMSLSSETIEALSREVGRILGYESDCG